MIKELWHHLVVKIAQRNASSYCQYLKRLGVKIGERCVIYPGASFGSEPYLISIGNHVTVTSSVSFVTHDGGVEVLMDLGYAKKPDIFGRISVGDNVFIGVRTTILPGVTIGNNVIIGAGSVVTKDIPDNSVAVGCPAKVIKSIEEYYEGNKSKIIETKYLPAAEKRRIIEEMNL